MAQNKGSNALIQQLLKAEEEADLVIKKAKDVRAKMLKEAETTATEELKFFRAKEKERLNKGHKEKSNAEDEVVTKIEQNTKEEIKKYKELFKKNKDQVAQFVFDKVFTVDLTIPDCTHKSILYKQNI